MNKPSPHYRSCTLCPRLCRVDRTGGRAGFCRSGATPRLAAAVLHRGEEPPLVTGGGSGALFFSECTLRCEACQNCQISDLGMGTEVTVETLTRIMATLAERGASNINIVTGTHFAPSIVEALVALRAAGVSLPVVWNTSGYERLETLELLDDVVDVWLPDLKTLDPGVARTLFHAADYPATVRHAIEWMVGRGPVRFDGDALVSGTVVRHLMYPGYFDDTATVLGWLGDVLPGRGLLSLMMQYLPIASDDARDERRRSAPARTLTRAEYEAALRLLERNAIDDGFVQELTDADDWRPEFERQNPFPPDHADPVWHWRHGFLR